MDPIVEVKQLTKIYHTGGSDVKALDNISLSIKVGEFLMITGKNGSGKSTLLHQLALLDKPSSGEIYIDKQEISHLSNKQRINIRLTQLGYIFQEYALIGEMTALENIMLPAMMLNSNKDAKQKALNLLKKVDLEKGYNRLPSELSGGEQQRVAIARSLINEPKIIFADEPTANLDTISSKNVLDIFKTLNRDEGITIIMVTHELEELAYSSNHIKLSDGILI